MTHGAIVLCGGLSTRMGRPKALLPWYGRTMIAHVVAVLREVVEDVVVVSSAGLDLPPLDARVVRDREPRLGPLGGIREGLEAVRADLAFVTSTDAPFLTTRFVRAMLAFGKAAAPEVDGYVQSLSAVYPKSGAGIAARLILEGRMRPLFLLDEVGFRRVAPDELPDLESIRSLNTPEDYLKAVRDAGVRGTVTVEFLGTARTMAGMASLEVAHGRLRTVLKDVELKRPGFKLIEEGLVADRWLVSLDGKLFVRDGGIAIGPGDRLVVMDAAAGG